MKLLLGILLAALGLGLLAVLWRTPPAEALPAVVADPRIERLETEVRSLAAQLERLQALAAAPAPTRERSEPSAASTAGPPAPVGQQEPWTPAWLLEQYVRSFDGGGEGSEYFRLAVAAYAPRLVAEIAVLVLGTEAPDALRLRLIEMLGDRRLRGHGRAIDTLLGVLRALPQEALRATALAALGTIGDASTAAALEGLVWSLAPPRLQHAALQLIVKLGADGTNRTIARLYAAAPTEATRAALLALLDAQDLPAALALLEQGSRDSQPVRLSGATALGRLQGEGVVDLVQRWLGFETDPAVRQALEKAKGAATEVRGWSARKAIGPPDANAQRDDPNAWASASPDQGVEWLELGYDPPLRCATVRIFEVNSAGAVAAIVAFDSRGAKHALWEGVDPTTTPGVFEVTMPATGFLVQRLRVVLDTSRSPGWNEIDAVELVGPDGRAWASSARASSSYGGG